MTALRRPQSSPLLVAVLSFVVFILPVAVLLLRFRADAPFYFLAEDSFYYLSIALHSAHLPFFSIDGVHPTNGFHPFWELFEYSLAKLPYFHLDGPDILPRIFAVNAVIVGLATALLSVYVHRLTRRPWLSVIAMTPGLIWLLCGLGAPAAVNVWANVNGMETGLELLFFSCTVLLFGTRFPSGARLILATISLGCVVLCRLDDVFFLIAIAGVAAFSAPREERTRRLAAFTLPLLMIAGYLFYNHSTVGVWMPVSGMAKVGKGYRAGIGESLHLLQGSPFWAMPSHAISFAFATAYTRVVQMFAPMAISAAWLGWTYRRDTRGSAVVQSLAWGVLLKGAYNFLRVPLGYQGAWYYGVSLAVSNLLLALFLAEALHRWSAASPDLPRRWPAPLRVVAGVASLLCLSFLSFNIVVSRASQNAFVNARDTYAERMPLTNALRASTSGPFLEFQDGELSFATGVPAMSAFGLAADPAAVRAQHDGTYFKLLAQRGVTVAAASGTYPSMLADTRFDKKLFAVWGYNAEEIQGYCFEPFWNDSKGNLVLYHIRHQPICPPAR